MAKTTTEATIAAVVYNATEGGVADQIFGDVADAMIERGYRLAGTVQRALERADRCACDMIVRDLAAGNELKISQDRGAHARGCRLDTQALEALVGSTTTAVEGGVDLLVINKFGKQEGLGAGFRDVIGQAVIERIPTIVAVNKTFIESWRAFADGVADELAPDRVVVETWLQARLQDASGIFKPTSVDASNTVRSTL